MLGKTLIVRSRKQSAVNESQTNLPLKVEEKVVLSPGLDLLTVSILFNLNAHAISCLLGVGHMGLALHVLRDHSRYRAEVDKLFPDIIPPFLRVLELEDPKLVAGLREDERKVAHAAINAAALIYSHAILEDVLVRLCEISIKRDPQSWLVIISDRKVSIKDAMSKSVDDVKADALKRFLKDFERFTLLDKCRTLLTVLQPKTCRRIVPKYKFSLPRLEQLDWLRHDMVHRTKFRERRGKLRDQHDYFLKTARFFLTLTQRKYNFKPLPSEKRADFDKLNAVCAAQLEVLEKSKPSD